MVSSLGQFGSFGGFGGSSMSGLNPLLGMMAQQQSNPFASLLGGASSGLGGFGGLQFGGQQQQANPFASLFGGMQQQQANPFASLMGGMQQQQANPFASLLGGMGGGMGMGQNSLAGAPFLTGFGPTTSPGGFSGAFGAPGITGFGFPPPFVDPFFFFTPAARSGDLNRLLGAASGQAVPINFGQQPSTSLPPFLLGFPFFG